MVDRQRRAARSGDTVGARTDDADVGAGRAGQLLQRGDRAVIDAALPDMAKQLDALEQAYGGRDYLVGNALSMADLFFAPIVEYLGMFPESQALLETRPNIRRGHAVMRARPSYAATQPKFD